MSENLSLIRSRWDNISYFKPEEFDSPDLEGSGLKMQMDFVEKLDHARRVAKIPFIINSGYRTEAHNAWVGGVINSSHVKGCAADIDVQDSRARSIIINALIQSGLGRRLGISSGFVHVDLDTSKPMAHWLYPSENVKLPDFTKSVSFIKSGDRTDWSHEFYNIEKLHGFGRKGKGVKIAVLDTGVDLQHDSFKKAISEGRLKAVDGRAGKNDPVDLNGHGCITPDSLVFTSLCGMNTIETFFDRVDPKVVTMGGLENRSSISLEPRKNIYTTSWDDEKFVKNKISHVHKFDYEGELIVLETNERKLELTPWHPVYMVTSSRGVEITVRKKRADKVVKGDRILCASGVDLNKNKYREINGYTLDENLAYFAGLVASDGHIHKNMGEVRFSNNDPLLTNEFENLCGVIFNKNNTKHKKGKDTYVESVIYSVDICKTLVELGIPRGNKSKTLGLPEIITKSPLSVIKSFYAGMIDGDGHISKKDGRIRIISGSKSFCDSTVDLMNIMGYNSSANVNSTKGFGNKGESITYHVRMPSIGYPLKGYKKDIQIKGKFHNRKSRTITSVSKKNYKGLLYDLTIENNPNYVSNGGYIVSNTWVVSRYISDGDDVLGFAPECSVTSYKVLNKNGSGNLNDVIRAARMAIRDGNHIISTSLGWGNKVPNFIDVVDESKDKGILWLSASGNDGKGDDIDYPAIYGDVISVGSHNKKRKKSRFSDWGSDLDLYSSGENVLGAYTDNREAFLQGTSMSTPSLGALIALIYHDIIKEHGKIDRNVLRKLATCQ